MTCLEIKDILINAGYPVKESGDYIQSACRWRGGDNETALVVYPSSGICKDLVQGETFGVRELIKRVNSIKTEEEVDNFLKNKNLSITTPARHEEQATTQKTFDISLLDNLLPVYDFYLNKKISIETLRLFKGGLATKGKLKDRFVFSIQNSKGQIVGFAGRDVTNTKKSKWFLLGQKNTWVYPAFLNQKDIREKNEVILVESIGNMISMREAGFNNVLVTFGTEISHSIINFLLRINIGKIIVSFDNDVESGVGQFAANKAVSRLKKYFDSHQIKIHLPQGLKDWGEIYEKHGKNEILKQWSNI